MNAETSGVVVAVCFLVVALGLLVLVRGAVARLDAAERRTLVWLLVGSTLALAPVLAVVPSPRLVGASMLGVAAVASLVLESFWWRMKDGLEGEGAKGTLALALGFAQLVHGPATAWLVGRHFAGTAHAFAVNTAALRAELGDPSEAEVGVVRGMGASFFAAFAVDPSRSPPRRWRILAQAGHVLTMRRDARTLEVIAPAGRAIFPAGSENLYRSERTGGATGDVFDVQGMRVTLLEVGPHGPRRVRYQFNGDLDDAPFTWINEDRFGAFRAVTLPPEGFGAPFDP
jgi:hypothetical protein